MIKLKDILNERKQRGVLYHFTNLKNLFDILKSNELRVNKGGWTGEDKDYISLSRNYDLEDSFGRARIALDGDDISNNYKIEPIMYHGGLGDDDKTARKMYGKEREERVPDTIKNIKRYIIQIDLLRPDSDDGIYGRVVQDVEDAKEKVVREFPSQTVNVVKQFRPVRK